MRRLLVSAVVFPALLFTAAAPVRAACGERAALLAYLAGEFGETPAARGLASNGTVLELLTSAGGSWTLVVVLPDGRACVAAAGEAWSALPPTAGPEA